MWQNQAQSLWTQAGREAGGGGGGSPSAPGSVPGAQVPEAPAGSGGQRAREWAVFEAAEWCTAGKGCRVTHQRAPRLRFCFLNSSPQQKLLMCRWAAILGARTRGGCESRRRISQPRCHPSACAGPRPHCRCHGPSTGHHRPFPLL